MLHCGAKRSCPTGAIIHDSSKGIIIELDKCIGCGACVKACPRSALKMGEI